MKIYTNIKEQGQLIIISNFRKNILQKKVNMKNYFDNGKKYESKEIKYGGQKKNIIYNWRIKQLH